MDKKETTQEKDRELIGNSKVRNPKELMDTWKILSFTSKQDNAS